MSKTALTSQDSIIVVKDTISEVFAPIFSNHNLHPVHTTPVANNGGLLYWPIITLFFVLTTYVYIKVSSPKKIIKIFSAIFSLQASKQLFREDYKLNKRVSILLAISFAITMAFLLYKINKYYGLILKDAYSLNQYLFFLLVIIIAYSVKFLFNHAISFIMSSKELGREYMFNVFVFCQTVGVFLFPLIIFMQFSKYPLEWFLYPSLVIWCGFYVMRLIRGFVISALEQNIGILYIFLYLCALEILPILVLIKFLLINF